MLANPGRASKIRAAICVAIGTLLGVCNQPLAAESTSAGSSTADPDVIKVGAIASITGWSTPENTEMINGMQLFFDQVKHTVRGKKVELIVEDDECSAIKSKLKFKKLVQEDKVALVGGIYFSVYANDLAILADQYKTPAIVAIAGADNLTQRNQHVWAIRSGAAASQRAMPMGDYAYKKLGYRKVITVGQDFMYGWEVIGGFQKVFEACGGKVIQRIWTAVDAKEFSRFIKDMRRDADAIFISQTAGESTAAFLREYRMMGMKLPLIGSMNAFDEQRMSPTAMQDALGAISVGPYCSTLDLPANKKFVADYQAKYHQVPGYYSVAGYTNAMWMWTALNNDKAPLSDREKLLQAVKGVKLDSPMGPLKLDNHDSLVCNMYIRKLEKINGEFTTKVIRTYPNVSQFWTWPADEYLKQPSYSRDYPPAQE